MAFVEANVEELDLNPFVKIGREWMLVTGGTSVDACNTMTASWGGLGVIWGKNVATIYLRPQRYTKPFVERQGGFTLSLFGGANQHEAMGLLGTVSGRDVPDKIARSGLTPVQVEGGVAFEQAELVLVCRTLYTDEIDPARFRDAGIDAQNYPEHDYHTMYIAEVVRALVKE